MPDIDPPEGRGRSTELGETPKTPPQANTVLVCLPPEGASAVMEALTSRGFRVVEAPAPLLASRAIEENACAVIVAADAPGVAAAVAAVRETTAAEVFCVGDAASVERAGLAPITVFPSPVDASAVVAALSPSALSRRPPAYEATFGGRTRDTVTPPADARPSGRESDTPPSGPANSDPLDVSMILPLDDGEIAPSVLVPPELSPELSQILSAAEERVGAIIGGVHAHVSGNPESDESVDIILPAELLASLDEPLDPDDESSSAGGASTGGTAHQPKTGHETGAAAFAIALGETPKLPPQAIVESVGTSADATRGGTRPGTGAVAVPATGPGLVAEPAQPSVSRTVVQDVVSLGSPAVSRAVPVPAGVPQGAPSASDGTDAPSGGPAVAASPGRDPPVAPRAEPPRLRERRESPLAAVLDEGGAVRALATMIASRASGSLALGPDGAVRRIVLHDGDIVTAASSAGEETLVAFLVARGDIERDLVARLVGRLPAHGRHAGAALVAHGHLGQDDLWPTLRAHAEWVIGRALLCDEGTCELEDEPPGRLKAEPNVFGGATGAEVLLEQIRRAIAPSVALARLGGPHARLAEGPRRQLLAECALRPEDERLVRDAAGSTVGELLAERDVELADVVYGLAALGVLEVLAPPARLAGKPAEPDPLDDEAVRQRVRARVALVEDGDYFALLGIARAATGYEVRRAYLELRRAFEPGRVLTAATADLAADVRLVVEVLDEAYEVLREPHRRDRYRRAIENGPP